MTGPSIASVVIWLAYGAMKPGGASDIDGILATMASASRPVILAAYCREDAMAQAGLLSVVEA